MKYAKLVDVYEYLEKTSARLKKVERIASLLEETDADLLPTVTLLVQGKLFPSSFEKEIGIAGLLMVKIIANTTGYSIQQVTEEFNKAGDYGLVIENLITGKKQQTLFTKKLTVEKVLENLRKLAYIEGKGSQDRKFSLVSELLSSASPKEAKYVVRTTLGTLRIGVAEGVVRDAIAKAFFADVIWGENRMVELIRECSGRHILVEEGLLERLSRKKELSENGIEQFKKKNTVSPVSPEKMGKTALWKKESKTDFILLADEKTGNKLKNTVIKAVEGAWFLKSDYGEIARIAKEKGIPGLNRVSLEIGKPYHVLLAEKAPSLRDALEEYENPVLEVKFDGARVSLHKKGEKIWVFTRRLENVTAQFPDIVAFIRKAVKAKNCIIEGEALVINPKTGRPLPFQFLSQRIQRKYDVEKTMKEIPVQINIFDVVYLEGEMLFDQPLAVRRKKLDSIIRPIPGKFQLAEQLVTKDLKKAEAFYKKALEANQEGIMVKNLEATYQPGRRVGYWLKVKPTMENLDLVIIGATMGTGKRTGWLGSFMLGCQGNGKFLQCGMLGTGIKEKKTNPDDVTFKELSALLHPLVIKKEGNSVDIKPKIIIEVAYEEVQKSPNYNSGYALRFPRFVRLRTQDKPLREVDSLERIEKLYHQQKGGK